MSSKRVTSQDVANAAGVSRTTVSLVLNKVPGVQISEETRRKVIAAARELNYVPDAAARALVSRRAQIIGLVLIRRHQHFAYDAFLTQTLDGMLEIVHEHGMRLLIDIVEPEHQKEAYLQLVRAKHIDGILLSGPRFDDEALEALEQEKIPVVLIGKLPQSKIAYVDVDNEMASFNAVQHLISLGHTRIACITNASPNYTAAAERLLGYRKALQTAEWPIDDDLIRYGDFTAESGYKQMDTLLNSTDRFSAVFIASDEVAVGAKAAIREHGFAIPQDIAIVGFDDLSIARYMDPPLTTVGVPAIDIARRACKMLISELNGEIVEEKSVNMNAHLIVRESCGASFYPN